MMASRRMGKFTVDREVLYVNEDLARLLYRGMIVFHTVADFSMGVLTVSAVHPDFEEIGEGQIPPTYRALIEEVEGEEPSITWLKED